ncbi:MAG: hypothetical protein H0T62_10075 [Parachlamydiaceae bacterium]|nr:hypothetical protein [Parachlamydiaceae bacterium]
MSVCTNNNNNNNNNNNYEPVRIIEQAPACCDFGRIAEAVWDTTISVTTFVGVVIAAAVFAVAHPIIGPLGSLGCLIKAAYDGLLLNYHWRHSGQKDEKGELIPGTEVNIGRSYRDPDTAFKPSDLERLQHEVERVYYLKSVQSDLQWARGLFKCTIPVAGPIWAFLSEMNTGGSIDMTCSCCAGGAHISDEEWLAYQIDKLEGKRPSVPVAERYY